MIENDLVTFLDVNIKESKKKARNIKIIRFYYGFIVSEWPTLEETAEEFGVSKERTRQLINENFIKKAGQRDFPSLKRLINLFCSKSYWLQTELEQAILDANLVDSEYSIKGLFNLMDDLGVEHDFDIYTPELSPVTRSTLDRFEENFILNKSYSNKIKLAYKKAKGLPSRCGIADLKYLDRELDGEGDYLLLKELIRYSDSSWIKDDGNSFWFLFEDRDNTLINYSEKIFSIVTDCDSNRLASTFRNALDGRNCEYPYPPESLIEEYLTTSIYFEDVRGSLKFIGETTTLNDIEKDIVNYLAIKNNVKYPEFKEHLHVKGYNESHIVKAITASPLVHVDKSKGRSHYEYSLVSSPINKHLISASEESRYCTFLKKLRKLAITGTDQCKKAKRRIEQSLLQQWLFEDKTHLKCAICGNEYHVDSLVTAHKKKRAKCNEAERLDPYIVMPVCLFGCDHLYERQEIFVKNGIIERSSSKRELKTEKDYIESLIGKTIEEQWLKGRKTYFEIW